MTLPQYAQRWLHVLTRPPRATLRQLTLYYLALASLGTVLSTRIPVVREAIAGVPMRDAMEGTGMRDLLSVAMVPAHDLLSFDLRMAIAMLGTLLITIPFSWGYMSIRERSGYEQSVVQTLVILPMVVAGIMMIVQFSLALALALGGVAAAVRFRNTLKDVADATYVFLAVGVGISAGTGALTAALLMSAIFTYVSVLLWRCKFGECAVAVGLAADDAGSKPTRRGAVPHLRGEITVEVQDPAQRGAIERVLEESTKQWSRRRASLTDVGTTRLRYKVRLKRSIPISNLSDALGVHAVDGANSAHFAPHSAPV